MLIVDDLHAYYGLSHVVSDVCFALESGEAVALLGRNGAGKTTTMAAVVGFATHRCQEIMVDGSRVDHLKPYQRVRAGIGYVPQSGRVFAGLSVQENLEIVRGRSGPWNVGRVFALFPELERLSLRDAGYLSGGERQMLAVGRALMANPSVLLLDEPTEGLAPALVRRIGDLVSSLKAEGLAILIAEQNHHFALAVADRALLIEKGHIRHEGRASELRGSEVLTRYLGV